MKKEAGKIFPEQADLEIEKDVRYVCFHCGKKFTGREMKSKKMPANFHVAGLEDESDIPLCPHCNAMSFFGFREA